MTIQLRPLMTVGAVFDTAEVSQGKIKRELVLQTGEMYGTINYHYFGKE